MFTEIAALVNDDEVFAVVLFVETATGPYVVLVAVFFVDCAGTGAECVAAAWSVEMGLTGLFKKYEVFGM
jgi:hypothetical protein